MYENVFIEGKKYKMHVHIRLAKLPNYKKNTSSAGQRFQIL
mgnify:CR=1 FL=1